MFDQYISDLKILLDKLECSSGDEPIGVAEAVERVVALIEEIYKDGRKIYWIGNGGSAAIAEHSALDYFRTGNIKSQAFNDGPMLTCLGNDFGYPAVFQKPVSLFLERNDILVAISSSGRSVNILNAVAAAKDNGGLVITLSGFAADNPLRGLGHYNFYAPSNRYGEVELAHGILCHAFLDLYMARRNGGR